jgi:hypothetical protein
MCVDACQVDSAQEMLPVLDLYQGQQNHQAFAALPQSSMELLEISSINDSQLLKTKCYVQSQVCSSKPCGVEDGAHQLFETAHRTATERVSTALQHR